MKNHNQLISFILVLCLLFSLNISVSASETQTSSLEVDIPIKQVNSEEEYNDFINQQESDLLSLQRSDPDTTDVTMSVVHKNYDGELCEVILHWTGVQLYDGWRFKSMKITNRSILFPETYLTLGNGISYTTKVTPLQAVGSVTLSYCNIPSNQDYVKAVFSDLQGRHATNGWLSAVLYDNTIKIN